MATRAFDPFRSQARLAWRNRWERWRRDGGQTLFHAAALIALGALLAVPVWQARAAWGANVAAVLQAWPLAVFAGATAVMTARQAARLASLRRRAHRDWLATLPVARAMHRRRIVDAVLREAALHLAVGGAMLLAARASVGVWTAFAVAILVSMLAALPLSRVAKCRPRRIVGTGSAIADHGARRLWRWQRLACGVALRGRTLAFGALALLTPPMDSGAGVAALVAAAGIALALLAGAWRRSLAVLPQAQAWLAAQPLSASRLLRGTWGVPSAVLACAVAAIAGVLAALGAGRLAAFVALALVALAALQFAVTAAERRHPRRAALAFTLQAMLLLGVVQAMPPAAVLLWIGQMVWLLRRALR